MKRLWLALLVLLTSCGGTPEEGSDKDGPSEVTLPPMSVGTIQAIGPHVYSSTLSFERPEDSSLPSTEEQIELVWLGIDHYRLTRWVGGELAEDEYRDGDLLVYRRGKGAFRWGRPVAGANYLMATITPFDSALVEFAENLQVVEEDPRRGDPEGYRRFALTLFQEQLDLEAERSRLMKGHSSVPISMSGSVVVDSVGNRIEANVEGTFRRKSRGAFDEQPTKVTFEATRGTPVEGIELLPPPEAAAMVLERKQQRLIDTSKTAPIP